MSFFKPLWVIKLIPMKKLLFVITVFPFSLFGQGQVFDFKELTTTQVEALDKEKTVVIIPGGLMEEHGPYLPLYSDGYRNEELSKRIGEIISEEKGFNVLIFPSIPLGVGSPETMGGIKSYPGVVFFRPQTFRAVLMDIGDMLAIQGFNWIFIVARHGAPLHSVVQNQACDYINENYGTKMVSLSSLEYSTWRGEEVTLTENEKSENGIDIHAGMDETSRMLYVAPELVNPEFADATATTVTSWDDFENIINQKDWKGYFGSPRLASSEAGEILFKKRIHNYSELAIKIIEGFDFKSLPRLGEPFEKLPDGAKKGSQTIIQLSDELTQQQNDWMIKNGIKN